MITTLDSSDHLLESIADNLEVPPSYYEKAADRYRSLGDWLHREESKVCGFDPRVSPQGSFRYGTVNWPLFKTEEYDLDLVGELQISKSHITQKQLKELLGQEIMAYAKRYGIVNPVDEGNRCWRLDYADDVLFHMDILPCLPEDLMPIHALLSLGVDPCLAAMTVAITDKRHPKYGQITDAWPGSNPRGLGTWFDDRARPAASARIEELVLKMEYRSIDEVPTYRWKSPLQRTIQILKRHRDVMFKDNSEWAPISMIITILAAKAYKSELNLKDAIDGTVERMPQFVNASKPRIPNPVNPKEDFADRWASDARYEANFWAWYSSIKADLANLAESIARGNAATQVRKLFRIDMTEKQLRYLASTAPVSIPAQPKSAPYIHIPDGPRPWRHNG